ncbi:site-specific DNA-methyltransferase [Ferrimonas futtsuensis]|uniref:site-specific DNA-methyltransferase n=1 Tax=Ferrimonas futtsuensis TaxID=364764 RepID=UPI0003FDD230|nr:site-specific DNA-methyltransferase [Ferrimonas futtsuensis]
MHNDQANIENYEFEPIKGYPMLNWKGKRPFRSTQYFPAQLKEVYGQEDDSGWINKIFWGDNLQVMSHLLKEFRGKVDFIYIDPPFDSKADYKKSIKLKGKKVSGDIGTLEEKQYSDIWSNDEYLQFMYERLCLAKELLSTKATLALHCDYRKNHHLKCILDEIFGTNCFRAEIQWKRLSSRSATSHFANIQDTILIYTKSDDWTFIPQFNELDESYIKSHYSKMDSDGRRYTLDNSTAPGDGPSRIFYGKEITPPPGTHWRWNQENIDDLCKAGRIVLTSNGMPRYKRYLDESKGKAIQSFWDDINPVNSQAKEDTKYPTQKPEPLLERLIGACTNKKDLVFDFFMGSGTTQAVANNLGRRFIGADINLGSIQTTTKRLASAGVSFEIYNVNNYDIFRNPIEAKDLIIDALEIQPLGTNNAYDGEKDGFKVKIMPVNRIATKEDLNEIIVNLPYKQFEERKENAPNQPVESIMLVCMGHEPGLGATLENESGFKMNVEVVDILRDKSSLTFKYDSEASIEISCGELRVEEFYPRNLLQKLSQQKEDISEWREMVESIMIDWNYNGDSMTPDVIDIPTKDDFVSGTYDIPESAGKIKIKITDLLSESYEEVINHD